MFDEAQRAWDYKQSKRKFNRLFSEPEMMLSIMDRHSDWCFFICLIGGGQEINTGEAGLSEWGRVLKEKFNHWDIHISPELLSGAHSTGFKTLFEDVPDKIKISENEDLHLKVSIRSYKTEKLSSFISNLLRLDTSAAKQDYAALGDKYPLFITRDLEKAKEYIKLKTRGTRRSGILATSGSRRLLAHGLDVTKDIDEAHWFLQPKSDIRSSSFMELPATEFAVQGLELDWSVVCWGADLRIDNNAWSYNALKGSKWQNVRNKETQEFIINKYRVLLTRAREGIVIWIPNGDSQDVTRKSEFYDPMFLLLKNAVKIREI